MDSSNGPNQQQQRYCPTPIMAPPTVATSPPLMSTGNVMNTLHQPTHHPPPSISPHPGAYYTHHTAGTSHYPTPSPTPPPPAMHHQQYYQHAHSYYAHGSHQQAQQQQQTQQSQHHAIANAHVPINTPPGNAQQPNQHSHLMNHASYHHPQSQTHHQQWAAPTHPHQQQSHHYYHQPQPTHHSPQQQQQQQQTQQHGYPPPPHSPYPPYVQPHAPAPTPPPPPHTPHAQQQHLQQTTQPQQHQHPPSQVSVSPGPGQIHQTSPQQQQQPQSHALMNLSRFVSQQSPPSPSPRASPNLAAGHHSQQMPQMGQTSPSPFGGHMEHHSAMNGHTSNAGSNNNPVMSPPPAPIPNQAPMSPSSPVSQHSLIMPPQIPHTINGGEMLDRRSPANSIGMSSGDERENTIVGHTTMKADASSNSNNKGRDLPTVFANITPSKIASFMNCDLRKTTTNENKQIICDSIVSQNNVLNANDIDKKSVVESVYSGISNASTVPIEGLMTAEISKELGDSITGLSPEKRSGSSSPSKQMGSPSSSGNGHQMMPVRLQNMHKGARTKANMKKLMQEQHIPPNGQLTDASFDSNINAKEAELMDSTIKPKQASEKPAKSPRKKKTQSKDTVSPAIPNDSLVSVMSPPSSMDLLGVGDCSIPDGSPVVRPGYTKSGKKIGRPRKDAMQTDQQTAGKPKRKRESKSAPKPKKSKIKPVAESVLSLPVPVPGEIENAEQPLVDMLSTETEVVAAPLVVQVTPNTKRKSKSGKTSRKRSPKKLSSEISVAVLPLPESQSDLNIVPILHEEHLAPIPVNESPPPPKVVGKKRSKKSVAKNSNITDSSPELSTMNPVEGSEISQQEAESVAKRLIQPATPTVAKAKRKGKKSTVVSADGASVTPTTNTNRRTKSNAGKNKTANEVVTNEITGVSPERAELPRLRSRSPKQRDSPPLRISSPRAAKERSSTPSANSSQTATSRSRSRSSKEKETGSIVTTPTPLSSPSPSLRSPKKSPEKDKEKVAIRSSSRQKAIEALNQETLEVQKDLISPPLAKRSRQVSQESLDSGEILRKGRRKPAGNEMRLSSDSERSLTLASKRSSRRKSGSVTGSTDNLSSSFNHTTSSLSLLPSDGSLEMPSDVSISTTADINIPLPTEQQIEPIIPIHLLSIPSKRPKSSKPRKVGKARSKSQRSSLKNKVPATIPSTETNSEPVTVDEKSEFVSEDQAVPMLPISIQLAPDISLPVRAKKSRKSPAKKNRRRISVVSITAPATIPSMPVDSNVGEIQGESNDTAAETAAGVPVKALLVKSKGRKVAGRSKSKKQKQQANSNDILNIVLSEPVAKKNVKFKPESKTRKPKQSKKSGRKVAQESNQLEEGLVSSESINISETTGESLESSHPQAIVPLKRRRSSIANATTSQVSAKLNTQNETEVFQKIKSSPTSSATSMNSTHNALRRDSRSISRDYDVSVVLTDIAQTFTEGDSSLLGISTSLSRLQSAPAPFTPIKTMQSASEHSSSVREKEEEDPFLPSVVNFPDDTLPSSNKRKRQSKLKIKSEGEQCPGKKKVKGVLPQPNQELQERKAILEAEVALVLLDLKTSPAKSIPSGGDSQIVVSKKKGKSRKRKHSKSPRRSITNATEIQENVPEVVNYDASVQLSEANTSTEVVKTSKLKRKGSKSRRSSNAKKSKMTPSILSPSTAVDINSTVPTTTGILTQSLSTDMNVPTSSSSVTSVKVAKTAIIPVASSFGLVESPISPSKSKIKTEKKVTPIKVKPPKTSVQSPDITAPMQVLPMPIKSEATKSKRKRSSKGASASPMSNSQNIPLPSNEMSASQADTTENSSSISTDVPALVKKKRQRKAKTFIKPTDNSEPEPTPSTSTATFANQFQSTSKLFPFQISPRPYKVPTVISKSAPFSDAAKDDDNQKKKVQDAPSVKVSGGLTKFYRGGELEEVDLDPKLPKEKTLIPTDNAVPWICSFCHLGPHAQKLGDLFGPYFADLPSIYGAPSQKRETWMHGDCALWAGRLLLVGSYLRGLETALLNADEEKCMVCGLNGATVGCLKRGCKAAAHYPCAIRRFWQMDDQEFHAFCPQHIS